VGRKPTVKETQLNDLKRTYDSMLGSEAAISEAEYSSMRMAIMTKSPE